MSNAISTPGSVCCPILVTSAGIPGRGMNSPPPLPVSREMAICRPVGITSVVSSGLNFFSVREIR